MLHYRGAGRVIAVRILLPLSTPILAAQLLQIICSALSVHRVVVGVLSVPVVLLHALSVLHVVGVGLGVFVGVVRGLPLPLFVYDFILGRRRQLLLGLKVMNIYFL